MTIVPMVWYNAVEFTKGKIAPGIPNYEHIKTKPSIILFYNLNFTVLMGKIVQTYMYVVFPFGRRRGIWE